VEDMTQEEMDKIYDYFRSYIKSVKWKFAKTYKDHPHSYTVRWDAPELDHVFMQFAQFIRAYGYVEYFYKKPFTFLQIDGEKFWTYGDPILEPDDGPQGKNTFILNRTKAELIYGA